MMMLLQIVKERDGVPDRPATRRNRSGGESIPHRWEQGWVVARLRTY